VEEMVDRMIWDGKVSGKSWGRASLGRGIKMVGKVGPMK